LSRLNFKVPAAFRRDFKITGAQRGKDIVEQLYEAYALLKEKEDRDDERIQWRKGEDFS